ncbi:MAG: phosphopantothenoylcysteine decarboxylase [Verrucomicrobiae bacterium]|nr:phosphopantothenoylcysteine decarboxylase [Verrucomicrobiae bacterium]
MNGGARRPLRFLVTAGPTREAIDPVRYLSNRSSGKMGYALAAAAKRYGTVVLVSGPTALKAPPGVKRISIISARQMRSAALRACRGADVIIQCAAVADYAPSRPSARKIKKSGATLTLRLKRTPDILSEMARLKKPGQLLVGFAAETNDLERNALGKLRRKRLDAIVANRVGLSDVGMESDENACVLIRSDGRKSRFARTTKTRLARMLLKELLKEKFR